jgi:hypothetical protein
MSAALAHGIQDVAVGDKIAKRLNVGSSRMIHAAILAAICPAGRQLMYPVGMTGNPQRTLPRADSSTWPPYVRPISLDELDGIGIDDNRQLYWHGKPVVVRNQIELSTVQAIAAIIGVAATVVIALAAAVNVYLTHFANQP